MPRCQFYGHSAEPRLKVLVPSHGNQCALLSPEHFSSCSLEIAIPDLIPRLENCVFDRTQRAAEYATFRVLPLSASAPVDVRSHYKARIGARGKCWRCLDLPAQPTPGGPWKKRVCRMCGRIHWQQPALVTPKPHA
jgi:hypothetical protein